METDNSVQLVKVNIEGVDNKAYSPEPTNGNSKPGLQTQKSHASHQDEKTFVWLEARFREIAGLSSEITRDKFKAALHLKSTNSFFAERMFTLFDRDQSGSVDVNELMDGIKHLSQATQEEKLKFLFDVYDVDGNGTIDPDELRTVLLTCMEESSLKISDEDLDNLVLALFESADEDGNGVVTFEELHKELARHPGVMENLTVSAIQCLMPPKNTKKKKKWAGSEIFTRQYYNNNKKIIWFYIVFLFLQVVLFVRSAVWYRKSNFCIIIARGCGMCLNFDCAFIVVLMLRTCLTWLRSTKMVNILPLDHSIDIHKVVGQFIVGHTVVHTIAHLGNLVIVVYFDVPAAIAAGDNTTVVLTYWEYLFTLKSGVGFVGPGFAFLSGVILDIILLIMFICSLPFVRRRGDFQIFFWTHLLFVPFWILLIMHGPIFWYFFIVPAIIYIIELIIRSPAVKLAKYGKIFIKEVNLLPSQVTHLVITKPENFHARAGDYVFIRIPEVAKYEWHPFTISSAPELKDEFWLHIRTAGNTTRKLYEFFENMFSGVTVETPPANDHRASDAGGRSFKRKSLKAVMAAKRSVAMTGKELKQFEGWVEENKQLGSHTSGKVHIEVFIDGPYGTPTRDMFNSEHAVLIGSGIGVTPFAAILQSIMLRYQATKVTCPNCDNSWFNKEKAGLKLRKVDFIWINRDQRAFEWFVRLLAQLEFQQAALLEHGEDVFLEMQLFMTAAASRNDLKGLGLQMAMEVMHKKDSRDVITGLKTQTQAGRPNWREVFQKIKNQKKGKVNVFFCGSAVLAKTLNENCQYFGFNFSKENF